MKKQVNYDSSKRSRNAIERVEKMAYLKHELTDGERLKLKKIVSPDVDKMPIRAYCKELHITYYFRNVNKLERWKNAAEDVERYIITIQS